MNKFVNRGTIAYLCSPKPHNMNELQRLKTQKKQRIKMLNEMLMQSRADVKAVNVQIKGDKPRRKYPSHYPLKYRQYITRAEDKGIAFDLTIEQFNELLSGDCHYCGQPGGTIDRINSAIGYIMSNSSPCCWICNRMKYTGTIEEMMNHIVRIYDHNNLSSIDL